jgi:primosomal protein N' (replication factor Y)
MLYFADVILPLPLKRLFTYTLDEEQANELHKGFRVAVPFGKSKLYTGIVFKIHGKSPTAYEAKPIYSILDDGPVVYDSQLRLWQWISDYYMCSLGEVMRAAIPGGLLLSSETVLIKSESPSADTDHLSDNEYLIYEALGYQSQLSIEEVADILNKKQVLPLISKLVDKGLVNVQEQLREKYKPKLVRYVQLHHSYRSEHQLKELLELLSQAPKQREAVLTLFQLQGDRRPVKVKTLIETSGSSSAVIKALIDKVVIEELFLEHSRIVHGEKDESVEVNLNPNQTAALTSVKSGMEEGKINLLHGVTSSGKTEIYIRLIEESLENSKQVLYLVPEIALTTQLVKRLEKRFGKQVLVFHSKYSLNERVEVWQNLLENREEGTVVIGARSAIFLPWAHLDLIIVDEEHEVSYKQFDPAPRYHARDTAIVLGKMFGAKILLGSATPSLESYYNAQNNKYHYTALKERFNNVLMPEMELVDLSDKYKRKRMTGHFSDRLIQEIQEALDQRFQVILFQNRRGFSPIIECHTCGHSPQCPNCDVSLTYHQYKNQLRCHYCGFNRPVMSNCEACGNTSLDTKGFGTEQVEEEAKTLFPNHRIARMDLDTTRGKYSFDRIIEQFEDKDIDILVGTQMVTKGLDFRDVKLVGVLNADGLLNFPDFRSHERCFQLLSQVAGRSGRTDVRGKVIIQTFNPYHSILQQVSSNDYDTMYKQQLEDRYQFHYPPIYRIVKISLRHRQIERVNKASDWFARALKNALRTGVLGPEFPPIARIRNQYHKNILIKIAPAQSLTKTKEAIQKIENSFLGIKDFRAVRIVINVDSY